MGHRVRELKKGVRPSCGRRLSGAGHVGQGGYRACGGQTFFVEGFHARLFPYPRQQRVNWRPVFDLSPFTRFLVVSPFHLDIVASVLESMGEGDWMGSVDLREAYFQVPFHPRSCNHLRFVWRGKVFQSRALYFGLAIAPPVSPWTDQHLPAPLSRRLAAYGVYPPDVRVIRAIFRLCAPLGVHISLPKTAPVPNQRKHLHGNGGGFGKGSCNAPGRFQCLSDLDRLHTDNSSLGMSLIVLRY